MVSSTEYQYLVAWRGFSGQDTWEPYSNLKDRADTAL